MSNAMPSAYVLKQPNVAPSVPNPRYMIRKDGLVLSWNQDVWNVDQQSKKLLRCVRDLPASYIRRLNAIKLKAVTDEKEQKEYLRQFQENEIRARQSVLDGAHLAQTSMQEITGDNLIAESVLQQHITADEIGDFNVLTASREELMAYSRDELNNPIDEDQDTGEIRHEVATMLGVKIPEEKAVTEQPVKPSSRRPLMGAVE